jgi:hypothetical protein
MGRKAARKKIRPIRRVAPTWVTPRLTPGDVLMLIDPDTWLNGKKVVAYRALLYAAWAALIALARIRPYKAIDFLLADYRADRLATVNQNGHSYPVVLLPLAVAAIDAYLEERDRLGIGGDHLFVDEKGRAFDELDVCTQFNRLAARYGHHGGEIAERLVEFFDEQLEGERRDDAAVIALRRGENRARDGRRSTSSIRAAAADPKRLRKVLERNHEFAGEAGGLCGGHGKTKAAKTARLFIYRKFGYRIIPFLRKDPVCARLLTYDWLKGNAGRRAGIVRDDLPHLERLLEERKIRPADVAYLLCMQTPTAVEMLRERRRARETAEERQKREEIARHWDERSVGLYRACEREESPKAFFVRIANEERYPFEFVVFVQSLRKAGIAPNQIARRQKKRMSG